MEASKYVAQANKLLQDFSSSTHNVDYTEDEKAQIAAVRDLLDKALEVLCGT